MNFKILGVNIKVSFILVAMLTLFSLYDKTGIAFCSVWAAALHECGHTSAALLLKLKIRDLTFAPFGIRMRLRGDLCTVPTGKKILLLLAGSLTNFITFFALCLLSKKVTLTACVHFVVGAFNLLPVTTLDGGRVLTELLSLKMDEKTAQMICDILSLLLAAVLLVLGAFVLAFTGYNASLCITAAYLAVFVILRQKRLN